MSTERETTKEKILDAACDLFAAKGYQHTTIKDICDKADVNIAAVNYHFGGKRKLFEQVWRHVFEMIIEAYPPDGGLPESATPEEKLRAHIASIINRIFDEGRIGDLNDLTHAVVHSDDEEIQKLMFEVFAPYRKRLEEIMHELAGPNVSEEAIGLCCMSTIHQCFGFSFFRKKMRKKINHKMIHDLSQEKIIDHVWKFSLAGIASVKAEYSQKGQ